MRFPTVVIIVCSLLVGNAVAQKSARVLYPINGAQQVSLSTSIGIALERPVDQQLIRVDSFDVRGSIGGWYRGTLSFSVDGRVVIFTPQKPFLAHEIVHVKIGGLPQGFSGSSAPIDLSFSTETNPSTISDSFHSDDPVTELSVHPKSSSTDELLRGGKSAGVPQGFPLLTVVNDDNPSDGDLYVANFKFAPTQPETYRLILDKSGSVKYAQAADSHVILDFKPHSNGRYTYFDSPTSTMIVLDSSFGVLDTLRGANGYDMDGHEMRYNEDGSYYVITLHSFKMDMRPIFPGADSNATVIDNVVQEFDRGHNLIFEWRGLDHYQLTDIQNESLSGPTVDYCHMNAIEIDTGGSLLFSCRHMDEITKVNRETGDIIWRWGGKNNQFTILFDTIGFSHQHAIRRVQTGTYTMFDNGNYHHSAATFSRAVEYKLDQVNKTASLVWEFRHQPAVYGYAMGYVQRMPNGNTLIGWGACNNVAVTEVGPFKRTVFEMAMDSDNYSYRAYKYPTDYLQADVTPLLNRTEPNVPICFPNPTSEQGSLRFSVAADGPVRISILNGLGASVATVFDGVLSIGTYHAILDVRTIPDGIYYVRITGEGMAATGCKIVVVK